MGMNALEVRRRVMLAQPHEAVAVGAVASFVTDVLSPLKMSFDLLPIQTGEGDPSPENVRPISGHDGFTRTRTGRNLFGGDLMRDGVLASMPDDATDDAENRVVKFAANSTTVQTITTESGLSNRFKEKTRYTFVLTLRKSSGQGGNLRIYYTDGTYMAISGYSTTKTTQVFVTSATKTVRSLNKANSSGTTLLYYDESGIFEGELTASEFEAYKGTSIETTFPTPPGTVYGGHVRDNGDGTGTLVVDSEYVTYDGETEIWRDNGANGYYTVINSRFDVEKKPVFDFLTALDKGGGAGLSVWQGRLNSNAGGSKMLLIKPDMSVYTTKELFATYLSQNPLHAVLKLVEPIEYTLSLTALQSLIGQNNIWVDNADEVSVEYWGH